MDERSATNTASWARRLDDSRQSSSRHLPCKIFRRAWKKKLHAELLGRKKCSTMLRGGLEVPWTNELAMKGKVAPAKRLEKTWSVVSSTRKRNCLFQGK